MHFITNRAEINFSEIALLLSREKWCKGLTSREAEHAAANSALAVAAVKEGALAGYLRVVSDCTCFAYLMDVVVQPELRRQGIGKAMVAFALNHEKLKHVYQWLLRTPDAQAFYAKAGFRALVHPQQWMLIQENRPKREKFEA